MEVRMITLWNKDVPDMDKGELEAELRVQKWLVYLIQRAKGRLLIDKEQKKPSWIRDNKLEFCDMYLLNLEALIAEIEVFIPRRAYEGDKFINSERRRRESARRSKVLIDDNSERKWAKTVASRQGINLQWDKELFLLVGKDRGYQTEEALVYAVEKELDLSRNKAKLLVDHGRFTWGQVMCIGAMLEMTPREFCDVFMSGYFVEYMGEYYASYDNIDKTALLKRAVIPSEQKNEADTEQSD